MPRAVALAVAALALPATAHAATVSVYVPPCSSEQSKYGACFPDEARFVAAPGERNRLTITSAVNPPSYMPTVTMSDEGAPVDAGTGCTQVDEHTATCTGYNLLPVVDAGDGNDTVQGPGVLHGGPGDDVLSGSYVLDGGPGNDQLQGDDQNNRLIGGPGHDVISGGGGDDTIDDNGPAGESDVIDGGAGSDTVDYDGRKTGVTVSLQQPLAGEDQLSAIENLRGGDGPDHLTGDAGPNVLAGGAGADTLDGGDGPDALDGGPGADRLAGGAGADTLNPGPDRAANVISCGGGLDRADPGFNTLLASDCERVGIDPIDFGVIGLHLPLARPADAFLTWDSPSCIDRPCRLQMAAAVAAGRRRGAVLARFEARMSAPHSRIPGRVALRLSPSGRRAVQSAGSIRARVTIVIDDGGDVSRESFLADLRRG